MITLIRKIQKFFADNAELGHAPGQMEASADLCVDADEPGTRAIEYDVPLIAYCDKNFAAVYGIPGANSDW